jgi:hypothetical protein
MVLYEFTKVKSVLGELGTTNDVKIGHYGEMADNALMADLINVNDLPNPLAVTENVLTLVELNDIKSFATQFCVGYFYKFESGDEMTIAEAKENWARWFNSKFRRPSFKVRGGETSR